MSGSQSRPAEGQDTGTPSSGPETQPRATSSQQGYQYPTHAGLQAQYGQAENIDPMRMSSLHGALPSVQQPVYPQGHQWPAIHPTAYPSHPQTQANVYPGYPQTPTQHGGMQYPTYVDHAGHPVQYSPMHSQFPGQPVYGGPSQAPQYGMYSPGFGPPSPVQQRGFHVPPRGFSGAEYGQSVMPIAQPPAPGQSRAAYPPGTKPPSTSPPVPAAPRGPPRKPKQSGHALWVGNLPPGTRVSDVKDHFAREATQDIESVFLISKSNCAFVNYRTEEACAAAMLRFHDSRFNGVRLVTRLRKSGGTPLSPGLSPGAVPSGPAAQQQVASTQIQTAVEAIAQNRESSQRATEATQIGEATVNDKYFIVKSLTMEDLELSVRNGIWATQGHNENALNKAYETVDNVYLIFSANKSGEYFGYARMESAIDDETAKTLEWKQHQVVAQAEVVQADTELPRSIPTPATEWAPKGRIIDDSARGTIFWEAESDEAEENTTDMDDGPSEGSKTQAGGDGEDAGGSDEEEDEETAKAKSTASPSADESGEASHQPFGRPFRVRWVSTVRLPFYRTRGLRNAWNANREVKIARDGTELETGVGRRLVTMFQRPVNTALQMQQTQYMGQMPGPVAYGMQPYPGRY